jgi:phage-related protein
MIHARSGEWLVLYYEDSSGISDVYTFIEERKPREKANIFAILSHLEEKGPHLPRPYADFLERGIHELRIKSRGNHYRILYFFCFRRYIVLTHLFCKKTNRVPRKEIKKALKRRADFLSRYSEHTLRRIADENI